SERNYKALSTSHGARCARCYCVCRRISPQSSGSMRIKLDQNLSQFLREDLTALKHDVDSVFDEGLSGAHDPEVLKAAASNEPILFTLDTDFLDLKKYNPDFHHGIIVFRPPRQG